ncbi:Uncharacterized protein dnm_012060 [Desulfonema magnum]|uniref:Uncharacterized protein n=1 Tax=Desulfonema magnum TaxID=45655 RepID=A0A975BGX1_9BACT|nr:Uncharacterized protein dnm_012060 [Desulfonema magnum]
MKLEIGGNPFFQKKGVSQDNRSDSLRTIVFVFNRFKRSNSCVV